MKIRTLTLPENEQGCVVLLRNYLQYYVSFLSFTCASVVSCVTSTYFLTMSSSPWTECPPYLPPCLTRSYLGVVFSSRDPKGVYHSPRDKRTLGLPNVMTKSRFVIEGWDSFRRKVRSNRQSRTIFLPPFVLPSSSLFREDGCNPILFPTPESEDKYTDKITDNYKGCHTSRDVKSHPPIRFTMLKNGRWKEDSQIFDRMSSHL